MTVLKDFLKNTKSETSSRRQNKPLKFEGFHSKLSESCEIRAFENVCVRSLTSKQVYHLIAPVHKLNLQEIINIY